MPPVKQVWILRGEGIECEKESFLFFRSLSEIGQILRPVYLSIFDLLENAEDCFKKMNSGDLVFIPGGFSFADHFGAGRLLSYQLARIHFQKRCVDQGLHVMGVCNGFQSLLRLGVFGKSLELLPNRKEGREIGFINRWVRLELSLPEQDIQSVFLPVRHGEGRLSVAPGVDWASGTQPFLYYRDENFDNGSYQQIAGLRAKVGDSHFIGMMPHPEIALRPIHSPTASGPDYIEKARLQKWELNGDGLRFFSAIAKLLSWESRPGSIR